MYIVKYVFYRGGYDRIDCSGFYLISMRLTFCPFSISGIAVSIIFTLCKEYTVNCCCCCSNNNNNNNNNNNKIRIVKVLLGQLYVLLHYYYVFIV